MKEQEPLLAVSFDFFSSHRDIGVMVASLPREQQKKVQFLHIPKTSRWRSAFNDTKSVWWFPPSVNTSVWCSGLAFLDSQSRDLGSNPSIDINLKSLIRVQIPASIYTTPQWPSGLRHRFCKSDIVGSIPTWGFRVRKGDYRVWFPFLAAIR